MKSIHLYKSRKLLLKVLMAIMAAVFIAILVDHIYQDWNDPNWLLILSLAFNLFALGYQYWRYDRNQTLEMHKDKIVYRTLEMKIDEVIMITPDSQFSKDWKGIHVKNDNRVQSISLEFLSKKEQGRLYSEIQAYYG